MRKKSFSASFSSLFYFYGLYKMIILCASVVFIGTSRVP